jgi:hypothetical protein
MHYCKYRLALHGSTNTYRPVPGSTPSGVSVFSADAIVLRIWRAITLRERLRCFEILAMPLWLGRHILVTSTIRYRLLDMAYTCFLLTCICLKRIGIDSSDDGRHWPSTAIFGCGRRLYGFNLMLGATVGPHVTIPFQYLFSGDIACIIEKGLIP